MSEAEQIQLLEQKNQSLFNENAKITKELLELHDTANQLQEQIDEKKHSAQLAAWAIDRAIETAKIDNLNPGTVTTAAQAFCDWIATNSTKASQ